jgi:hypothetical protein
MPKTVLKNRIVIEVRMNAQGDVALSVVNKRWRRRFQRLLKDYEDLGADTSATAYLQHSDDIAWFKENYLPRRYWRDLEHGWRVRFYMDPWVFGQGYLGYDCGDRLSTL